MSGAGGTLAAATRRGGRTVAPGGWSGTRVAATAGVAVLLGSSLSVLHYVSDVAGDPWTFTLLVVGSLAAATALARVLPPRPAFAVALGLLVAGSYIYLQTLPDGAAVLYARGERVVGDAAVLLSGLSVLRIVNAGTWALAATPGPTFLTWYLTVRRRYVPAVAVGGATLGAFVLTGDASLPVTLLGAVGGAAAVGFGDLDRRGGSLAGGEVLAVVLAAMVACTLVFGVVPGGASDGPGGGFGADRADNSMEAALIDAGSEVTVKGAIQLSPRVRFTVRSEESGYWRVRSYDRFTGQGWVSTGTGRGYEGPLSSPPVDSRSVRQRVRVEDAMGVMPALWKPREVVESDTGVSVTTDGGLSPARTLGPGEGYTVVSRVPDRSPSRLRRAGTDYPPMVRERFLQVPASTPDRVAERTARITANAENPYDTARVLERWLQNNKRYSLSVERPDGNVADAFLFEMNAGYCVYYATTMVTMLRTQGIPARFVVGYAPGQQLEDGRRVVRGLDAHAWVEAYFPGRGWVRFDPTPAEPRRAAERTRLEQARAAGQPGVDVNGGGNASPTTPPPTTAPPTPTTPTTSDTAPPTTAPGTNATDPPATPTATVPGGPAGEQDGGLGSSLPELPSREWLALFAVVLSGAVAGLHRSGVTERAYRELWLRHQPRVDPATDVERAFERLSYLRARDGWPRQPGETPRQYLANADSRARRVGELYERARYAGRATEADADEAVGLVDDLVEERGWLP